MESLPSIVNDLALILICAGFITVLFRKLRQPVVLGYIVAGILTGPNVSILPFHISDMENIHTWANIGVIFLLFALGLDFSLKKLASHGMSPIIGALSAVFGMLLLGTFVGFLMGWSMMDCIFLGSMLSMSSTTIILKSFDDLNMRKKKFADIVLGILIVEDLAAVLIMVMLSTFAGVKTAESHGIVVSLLRLVFFLIICFLFGIYVVPSVLKFFRKYMNDETLMVVSVGFCFVMVVIAVKAGFSAALGAFIMGSILSGTTDAAKIEKVVTPIKNLFGAIFFVSVGMLVDPVIIVEYIWPILIITLTVMVGQILFPAIGLIISGNSLVLSLRASFCLPQVGEFAFIIATLGLSLGAISPFLYPVIISVSLITTFTTPYFIKLSESVAPFIDKHLPKTVKSRLDNMGRVKFDENQQQWQEMLKPYFINTFIFTFIVIAVIIVTEFYIYPYFSGKLSDGFSSFLSFIITFAFSAPFLSAMMKKRGSSYTSLRNLILENKDNRKILGVLSGIRFLLVYVSILYMVNVYFHIPILINILVSVFLLYFIFHSKFLMKRFWQIESRFLINLNEKEMNEREVSIQNRLGVMHLNEMGIRHWLDYKLYTCALEVKEGSPLINKKIKDLDFRIKYDIIVIRARNGKKFINIPSGEFVVGEGCILRFVGRKKGLKDLIDNEELKMSFVSRSYMTLHGFSILDFERKEKKGMICSGIPVNDKSPLANKSLSESNIPLEYNSIIIGIERKSIQYVNPNARFVIKPGDIVWVMGEEKNISSIIENNIFFV